MSNNQEENQQLEEGKMLAIEAIIRSKFGDMSLQCGDQAMSVLRSKQNQSTSSRVTRYSTRQMPAVRSQFPARTLIAVVLGAALPMAVALCVFMYMKYLESSLPGRPKIFFASTDTKVIRDSKAYYLKVDMPLLPNDKVVTGKNGRVELKYVDGSHIAIESSSEATFVKNGNDKKIFVLNQGALFAEIAKQTKDSYFNFYTKNALVDVIGTSFDLSSANDLTALKMKTGKVKVTNLVSKEEQFVSGGEQLTIDNTEKPAVAKKLDLFQMHQESVMAVYHFSDSQKKTVKNLIPEGDPSFDFQIHQPSGLRPRKESGIVINMETYFINKSLKQLLSKFAQSNEFSIELWVKPNEEIIRGDDSLIFGAGMSESAVGNMNWMIYIGQTGGKIKGALHTIGKQEKYLQIESKETLEPKPTHIVFLKDKNGAIKLFVNGVLSTEAVFDKNLVDWGKITSGNLLMGGTESGSHSWQGGFYLMAFYEKALTDAEVLSSYQAGY